MTRKSFADSNWFFKTFWLEKGTYLLNISLMKIESKYWLFYKWCSFHKFWKKDVKNWENVYNWWNHCMHGYGTLW